MEDNNDTLTITTSDSNYTVNVDSDLDWGTLDVSSVGTSTYTGSTTTITLDDIGSWGVDEKRTSVRDGGELPIDIWAKMYNNGVIDDE